MFYALSCQTFLLTFYHYICDRIFFLWLIILKRVSKLKRQF